MTHPVWEIVQVCTPAPVPQEVANRIQEYVATCIRQSKPVVLEEGYRIEIVKPEPMIALAEHDARVVELLQANNSYQERYRKAEAKLRELGATP